MSHLKRAPYFLSFAILASAPISQAQISSPADISGLVVWVDGKDVNGTGVQPADGSIVSIWVNKGSGANLTTQDGTVTFEATGFDGMNPGLRFPLVARMGASNPFAGNRQNAMTVLFVMNNVTQTKNASVSLNGLSRSGGSGSGRTSFHTPWTNNDAYFDAGGCCGANRLQGTFPNPITETSLYTGLNDEPGNRQWLRVDGGVIDDDLTGHDADVSGGINIGEIPKFNEFDGRFAEVVIYNRALSLAEVEDIECFLLLKWKPSAAPTGCAVNVTGNKSVTVWDPLSTGLYALPGNDVMYSIILTHESGPNLDDSTVFIVDTLPPEVVFYNDDIDGAGPESGAVKFVDNGSGLSFDPAADVSYSSDPAKPTTIADCNYYPGLGTGYDSAVKHICIHPSGTFNSGTPDPSFTVSFRARIN